MIYVNDEAFRLSLIDITNLDLLNDFVNDIFKYDMVFDNKEYVYIQYKIINNNVVINIYDNKDSNRFKAYIFTLSDITNDDGTTYINVKDEYDKYLNGDMNKICLLSSLLISNNNNEKRDIIEHLFTGKIKEIFSHYFL